MPAPAGLAAIFPQDFLNAASRIATQEARDPRYGANPGTFASILNRYHHPGYGKNWQSWLLNPNQYAVLKKPQKESGAQARQFYNSPEGLNLLQRTAQQLGGATDFRSTSYLQGQGLLMKYPDNLIPVQTGGGIRYLPPAEIRKQKLSPYLRENTFFSESGPAKTQWWQKLGPQSQSVETEQSTPDQTDFSTALAGQNNPELMELLERQMDIPMLPKRRETPTSSFANFLRVFGPLNEA
jgi:hypothetical protein